MVSQCLRDEVWCKLDSLRMQAESATKIESHSARVLPLVLHRHLLLVQCELVLVAIEEYC